MAILTDEVREFLDASRAKRDNYHITGRVNTGQMIVQIARITGFKQKDVKKIIYTFIEIMKSHLRNHRTVTLLKMGIFSFSRARGRKITKERLYEDDGSFKYDMTEAPPTCRLKFRPAAKFRNETKWFPKEELEEERVLEEERIKKLQEYLKSKEK